MFQSTVRADQLYTAIFRTDQPTVVCVSVSVFQQQQTGRFFFGPCSDDVITVVIVVIIAVWIFFDFHFNIYHHFYINNDD